MYIFTLVKADAKAKASTQALFIQLASCQLRVLFAMDSDAPGGGGGGGGWTSDCGTGSRNGTGDGSLRINYVTKVFIVLLFASLYLLSRRWREKERSSTAALTPSEIAGAISFIASLLYLLPRLGHL
ncbi:uncharacterized protein LOC121987727 [Zingiber officinale]|uniref:uncharacterized protein LOC121987727 n=1 Tax=Zingiber officinale TaxID=94328 RepID=UPI001C4B6725|nr:uncharacterized protein LOC121987727 [Zingiber officinale]